MSKKNDIMEEKQEKDKIKASGLIFTRFIKIRSNQIGIYLMFGGIVLIYVFLALWPRHADVSSLHAGQIPNIEEVKNLNSEGTADSSKTQPKVQNEQKDTTSRVQDERKDTTSSSKIGQNEREMLWSKDVHIFKFKFKIPYEVRMILLVIIAGAIGSYLYMVESFIYHVGGKTFDKSWTWWYLLGVFRGSTLALIFYLIIRGGLLNNQITGSELGRFGITGTAGVIGLFSKQAMKKLREILKVMFLTEEDKNNNSNQGDQQTQNGDHSSGDGK